MEPARLSNCSDKSWATGLPSSISLPLGSNFLTPVERSWKGESVTDGVKWLRMNLEVLVGEVSAGETAAEAALV